MLGFGRRGLVALGNGSGDRLGVGCTRDVLGLDCCNLIGLDRSDALRLVSSDTLGLGLLGLGVGNKLGLGIS